MGPFCGAENDGDVDPEERPTGGGKGRKQEAGSRNTGKTVVLVICPSPFIRLNKEFLHI